MPYDMTEHLLIEAVGLEKAYRMKHGPVEVLKGINLSIYQGESVAVMGASGSGKSTLLHLLAGLDVPDYGEVLIEGEPLHQWRESRRASFRARNIGIVFQYYHLLPDLNVLENALMPLRALSGNLAGKPEERERVISMLSEVGLEDRLLHRPVELSGGEQQRLAVIRALVNNPGILMADEPTGNLDVATGDHLLDELFRLGTDSGRTLVMVTHDPRVAERCTRTIRLEAGQVV